GLGRQGRLVHRRHGAGDRGARGGRDRPRRCLRRVNRRRQHQPRHRADRPAALQRADGRGAGPRSGTRHLVRAAGAADGLSHQDRDRDARGRGPRGSGDLSVYVLVVGAGKVGWNLTRELIARGNEVTVIESDAARYATVEEELEHSAQYGDGSELWVLERAGIERAGMVIAVTGDDEDNLLICQVAREKYGVDRVI